MKAASIDSVAQKVTQEENPMRRLMAGTSFAEQLRTEERRRFLDTFEELPDTNPMSMRRKQLRYLVGKTMNLPKDVERRGERLSIVDMQEIPGEKTLYGTSHIHRFSEQGWPFDAELLKLNGDFEMGEGRDRPAVYFLQSGEAKIMSGEVQVPFTQNFQVALPAHVPHAIKGNGTLFILHMLPKQSGGEQELVAENFDAVRPVKCPCGDSHRIKLSRMGWDADTHLTKIRHFQEGGASSFKGHQHKKTTEVYFASAVHGEHASMTVDGQEFPLREGMVVALPNGTLHTVEGDVDVRILVGGGHKDDDFWANDWQRL